MVVGRRTAARASRRAGAAVVIALGVGACTGTETGNPNAGPMSDLRFVVTDTPVSSDPAPTVEEAYLGVRSLVALACDSGSTVLGGPTTVDLIPSPSAAVSVPEASCCGIAVELEPQSIGPEGATESASILIRGTVRDGVPFVLSSSTSHTLTLSPTEPPLLIDSDSSWLLSVDVGVWFSGLGLSDLQSGADGIRIDSESYPEVLTAAEERLGMAVALRRDLDGDGQVDPEDVPVALPP
jgi:hypothetical protein